MQHHFGLFQAFRCNKAFQQQAPLCLAEVLLIQELPQQRFTLLILSLATRSRTGFRGHGGRGDPTDQSSTNHGRNQQQNPARARHPISNQPLQSEEIAVGWLQSS